MTRYVRNWVKQRNTGLLCAVLKVVKYSLWTFPVLTHLPYCIRWTHDVCQTVLLEIFMWPRRANTFLEGRILASPDVKCQPTVSISSKAIYTTRVRCCATWLETGINEHKCHSVRCRTRKVTAHLLAHRAFGRRWWRSRYGLHGSQPCCLLGWSTYRVRAV